ncbi:DMT family transporter [Aestuariivirga sp.]|uniref:DMT family transporter n=1 Tax=Aestuariivirga sp. TaxID=2650926 RepID=UPI0039E223B4
MTSPASAAAQVRKGLAITAIGGLLFTLDLPLLRLAGADIWTLVFARGVFLFLSITACWYLIRASGKSRAPYIAGIAGLAVIISNTISNITYIGAIKTTSGANVVFIIALIPLLAACFSRLFIGERVHPFTWAAIAASFLGVGLIVWDGIGSGHVMGDLMALVSAICTATNFTIIRASGKNVATSVAVGSLLSAIIALLFAHVDFGALTATSAYQVPAWVWIALNGLIAIPLATALIANGPRFIPSADVSMFFLLETVLTPLWIWMLFNEVPSSMVLFGGMLVIVTLIVHSWWRLRMTLRGCDGETANADCPAD